MEPRLAWQQGPEESRGRDRSSELAPLNTWWLFLVVVSHRAFAPLARSWLASPESGTTASCIKAPGQVVLEFRGRRQVCGESCQVALAPSGPASQGRGQGPRAWGRALLLPAAQLGRG